MGLRSQPPEHALCFFAKTLLAECGLLSVLTLVKAMLFLAVKTQVHAVGDAHAAEYMIQQLVLIR
jgi:hypothetical protein